MHNTCQMEKKKTSRKLLFSLPEKGFFEAQAWKNQSYLCGIDEVGRGCLAGPVVTACVILPHSCTYPLLIDSKMLSEKKRLEAYEWITKNAWYTVALANHRAIDSLNIYKATQLTMKRAVYAMLSSFCPRALLYGIVIDAMPLSLTEYDPLLSIWNYPKGEHWSPSIAAASLVAKVTRDQLLAKSALFLPGYALERHKGYGTQAHYDALSAKGKSLIHRNSFLTRHTTPHDSTPIALQQTIFKPLDFI